MRSKIFWIIISATLLLGAQENSVDLDYAQVLQVEAFETSPEIWTFSVTVRHNDEGWDHYADRWQVVDPETEEVIAERVLLHPHDNEQPFTRSLGRIEIPAEMTTVLVRAGCNVHGFGGGEILLDLVELRSGDQ
jgi:hypothetical protein